VLQQCRDDAHFFRLTLMDVALSYSSSLKSTRSLKKFGSTKSCSQFLEEEEGQIDTAAIPALQ
jgi:hypothetical protein